MTVPAWHNRRMCVRRRTHQDRQLALLLSNLLRAVAVAACYSAVVCAAALRLGRPVPGCAASLVAAVRRWFAPPVWLGLRCAVDLLLLCVSDVGDMPAVDGEAGITKSKAKCALSSFPRAPLRHAKKAILVLAVAVRSTPLPWREPRRGSCLWPLWQALRPPCQAQMTCCSATVSQR
jgi:hypothetical protein